MMRRLILLIPVPPLFYVWGFDWHVRQHRVDQVPLLGSDRQPILFCTVCGVVPACSTAEHRKDLVEALETAVYTVMPSAR
jgi:hypothetical protein